MAPFALAIFQLHAAPNPAYAAEDTVRGSTALNRSHPELAPMGIRSGSFVIFPDVSYSLSYNDNVFASENNIRSSSVSEISPSITAISDWNNHELSFRASALDSTNHEFSSEDYTDWRLQVDGRTDISRHSTIAAGAGIGTEHIPRSAPDDARGIEPTEFDSVRIFTRYSRRSGRRVNVVNLNLNRKEYRDVEAIRLGVPVTIDNSDRDRTETRLRLRSGYRYVAEEQFFITLEGIDRDYDRRRNFSGQDQSSTGLEATAGLSFDYHGIILGEIALGYRSQDYEQPQPDIHEPIIETSIRWNVTDLTTVNFNLDHEVEESFAQLFSGYTSTTAEAGVDHELRRNLVLNLSLGVIRDDYVGVDTADRRDFTYYFRARSLYRINRNLFINSELTHLQRSSDLDTGIGDFNRFDFTQNLISFELQARF